jgi:hypothetical protein
MTASRFCVSLLVLAIGACSDDKPGSARGGSGGISRDASLDSAPDHASSRPDAATAPFRVQVRRVFSRAMFSPSLRIAVAVTCPVASQIRPSAGDSG